MMPVKVNQSIRENVLALNKDIEETFVQAHGLEGQIELHEKLGAPDEETTRLVKEYKEALIHLGNLQNHRHQLETEWVDKRLDAFKKPRPSA